ncbi:Gfo/Idh/MocA family protein [Arenimonas daejeonensis]|uniref:Gfo/Idh/MocA family protein n=1 Tax=Arenimonas daejeonensis TaxID=370777 RepID=UPI0011BE51ED|nr:Gfo/Idh/MocA family oxidoreductase [Arenimonas daejeonensis]
MDVNINRAASLASAYGARYFTDDAFKVISDPDIDLIYIASNHASHAEYAIEALRLNKNVHIEKPHVVTLEQLRRLEDAMNESAGLVNLGFNRPNSKMGRLIKSCLDEESGAAMLSWFIAGHEIADDHWYFKKEEGGGS